MNPTHRSLFFISALMLAHTHLVATGPAGFSTVKWTPKFTDTGSEGCLSCHSGEKMRALAAGPHGKPENPLSPAALRGCESCHGPGSIHVSRAHGGRGFPPMTRFGRGSEVSERQSQLNACLSCHGPDGSGRRPIEWYGGIHDRRTINCSTCHTIHLLEDPLKDPHQQARICFRCHRKQREEHPRFEDKSIDFDALSCWTCHDVHRTNFMGSESLDFQRAEN